MIKYSLKCEKDHSFDSWFQSAGAFDKLLSAGMVTCAVCGALGVEKAIMAPRVRLARTKEVEPGPKDKTVPGPLSAPASPAEQALQEMRKRIEANSENVGTNFANEARAIHDGDAPNRSIFGEARPRDAKALIEEGILVTPLPWGRRKLN